MTFKREENSPRSSWGGKRKEGKKARVCGNGVEKEKGKERKKIPLIPGKGEASLLCSLLSDHQGSLSALAALVKRIPFKHQKLAMNTSQNNLNWDALSRKFPLERCRHSPYKRWERPRRQSPSCGQPASYLWSLLWPSDYGDPGDSQTGVVFRVLLQDILWPNKGAVLAQGRGKVFQGGWRPNPSQRATP